MRVSATKTTPRVERNVYLTSKRIKAYGSGNDYPQKILEIVNASGTGKTCVNIYIKFVEGNGFEDQALATAVVNQRGETVNSLLRMAAKDFEHFNGFALLIKYNFLGQPVEFYNVPFEHCRLEIQNKEYTGRIAVYDDWTNLTGKSFKMDDVRFVDHFAPEDVIDQIAAVGSPLMYYGQILYYTADNDFEYPISPFDPVVTDMLTEDAVSTVKHRNAKYNFLPAGILVRKGKKPRTLDNGSYDLSDPVYQEQQASAAMIKEMQGDEKTSKIWVVDVDADEEKPEFIDFSANNYDKQYENTERTVQENIGRMFGIPPILRGVDIGAGFGADLMTNAYNYMNAVTAPDRRAISEAFKKVFAGYGGFMNFTINALTYL